MNEKLMSTDRCFMCGKNNPIGLKMEIKYKDGEAFSKVNLDKNYEGYSGNIHGGIITALLDEIAVYAAFSLKKICVTYEIKVKFRKPVQSGKDFNVYGKVIQEKGKITICNCKLYDEHNNIYAEAEIKLFSVG